MEKCRRLPWDSIKFLSWPEIYGHTTFHLGRADGSDTALLKLSFHFCK